MAGDSEEIVSLLDQGADVNSFGLYPKHTFAKGIEAKLDEERAPLYTRCTLPYSKSIK